MPYTRVRVRVSVPFHGRTTDHYLRNGGINLLEFRGRRGSRRGRMFKRCLSTHRSIRISNSKHAPSYIIYIYRLYFTLFSFFLSQPIPIRVCIFPKYFIQRKRERTRRLGEIWRNCGKKVWRKERERERRKAIMSDTRQYPPSAIGQKFTWRGN